MSEFRPRIAICTSVHVAEDARVTFREGRALARAFDATLYVFADGDDGSIDAGGGQELAVRRLSRRSGRFARFLSGRRLLRTALADGPDIVLIHDPELLPWALTELIGKVPVVYDAHEDYAVMVLTKSWVPTALRRILSRLVDVVERAVARRIDLLVVADQHLTHRLGPVAPRTVVLRNYPPTDLFDVGEPVAARDPIIVYIGGVTAARGLGTMLEAFRIVRERLPRARLEIVGPAQDTAGRLLVDAGEGVSILGAMPYDAIGPVLARARVGLALLADTPKYRNDVPSKLYDYMCAGVPYVASDLPGIRSTVGEIGGVLVDPADAAAVADAVICMLTDDRAAEALRAGGMAAARDRFSFDAECDAMIGALREVLGDKEAEDVAR
ncbi:MAG: glycosyltransferase family 4 protein [Coriobacteriia bacterium]|nr:glycosyltransferase family 4 protein [Coriobacteriia bacterium]